MSKQSKHRKHGHLSQPDLEGRARKALNEGRSQQALELARQLHKQEPTPAHLELVKNCSLERALHLRSQGYTRDALTVLENAAQLPGDETWLGRVAEELAASGNVRRALELLQPFPESPLRKGVLEQAADTALGEGKAGRKMLPESLQAAFDLILQAFAQAEAGQDDQARETLQGIGLQSPFLEWKLFLRGLLAYYQKDDARALENWQRLNPDRLPARLAAPLRFTIDPAYRAAQAPALQARLQKWADRLQGSVLQQLRSIQMALVQENQLPQAFRQMEGILPALRQEAPHLVPRLAACFYWTIVTNGQPEDMTRFRRVFGTFPDDPGLERLQALVYEHMHDLGNAHKHWQKFEESVKNNSGAWPPEQANHVRALIWTHMGHNAASVPDPDKIPDLPPFLLNHPDRPRPLKPSAEECFQHAIELAPDLREGYEALFRYYQDEEELEKA
ncbi:MAG: hypothetical protein JO112_21070, partial [Planctomycetes bacterium]|nr:hypothetical protein [Planctomycetota bacterium]